MVKIFAPLYTFLGIVFKLVTVVEGWLLYFVGSIFDIIIEGTTVDLNSLNQITTAGWVIVRDIVNVFFIIFMLVIAFATILKIESYQFKALMPKLIIAAILVNFSKTICFTLIAFFNTLMSGIMKTQGGAISSAAIAALLRVDSLSNIADSLDAEWITDPSVLATYVVMIIFLGMLLIGIAGLTALLLVRIVVLMVLTVFSPVAFVFNVIPATKKYASDWWDHFMKYLFTGPVVCLCFLIALVFASQFANQGIMAIVNQPTSSMNENAIVSSSTIGDLFGLTLACGFLMVGFTFTNQVSSAFAGAVMKGAKKGLMSGANLAFRKPLKGLSGSLRKGEKGILGKGLNKIGLGKAAKFLPYFSPGAWKEGYGRYKQEKTGEESIGVGRVGDTIGRALTLGKKRFTFEDQAKDNEISRLMKAENIKTSPKEQATALRAVRTGNTNLWDATIKAAVTKGERNTNDVVCAVAEEFRPQLEKAGLLAPGQDVEWSPEILEFINTQMHATDKDKGAREFAEVCDLGFESGIFSLAGRTTYDAEKNQHQYTGTIGTSGSGMEAKKMAIIDKISKIEALDAARILHGNSLRKETFGQFGDSYEEGETVFTHQEKAFLSQVSRTSPTTWKAICASTKIKRDMELAINSKAEENLTVERGGAATNILKGQALLRGDRVKAGSKLSGADFGLALAKETNSTATIGKLEGNITALETSLSTTTDAKQKAVIRSKIGFYQNEIKTANERAAVAAALTIEAHYQTSGADITKGVPSGDGWKKINPLAAEDKVKYAKNILEGGVAAGYTFGGGI